MLPVPWSHPLALPGCTCPALSVLTVCAALRGRCCGVVREGFDGEAVAPAPGSGRCWGEQRAVGSPGVSIPTVGVLGCSLSLGAGLRPVVCRIRGVSPQTLFQSVQFSDLFLVQLVHPHSRIPHLQICLRDESYWRSRNQYSHCPEITWTCTQRQASLFLEVYLVPRFLLCAFLVGDFAAEVV